MKNILNKLSYTYRAAHLNSSNSLRSYIKFYRNFRVVGTLALAALLLVMTLAVYPITIEPNTAEALPGTATASSTYITMTSSASTASVNLTPRDGSGTFASSSASEQAAFNVATNNVSGYELSVKADDDTKQLINNTTSTALDSITSVIDSSTFSNPANTSYNGKWGYVPSKYNSTDNASFRPAPTTTNSTLDKTTIANTKKSTATGDTVDCTNYDCNEYTIALGARADMGVKAGTYTNTFILTAVGNPVTYSIDFEDLSGDTSVTNMPADITDVPTSSIEIDLPSTIPTRTKYTFNGWCSLPTTTESDGSTTCSSTATIYNAGGKFGIDQTTTNDTTLYAIWELSAFDITIKTAPGITKVTLNGQECTSTSGCKVEGLIAGETYNLAAEVATVGYNFGSWSESPTDTGTFGSTTSANTTYTVGASDSTITPSATPKNNLSLTIAFSAGVSSVAVKSGSASGTTVGTVTTDGGSVSGLTYGQNYYLVPSYTSGATLTWAQNNVGSGGTGLSSTSDTTPYFNIGDGTNKVTLTAKHTITFKTSNAQSIVFNGTTYTNNQTVQIVAGSYSIRGNYDSRYAFSSWSVSGSGSFGNSAYQNTTFTVSGAATITLTGQYVSTSIQSITSSTCTTTAKPVYDTRDNEVYWIQKLADNKCWMLDNLRLGVADISANLTSSNTNLSSTISASTWNGYRTTSGFESYTAPMFNSASANNTTTSYGSGSGKIGVYYNYCAASAGTYCYAYGYGTGNASYDICPKGWRMPTGGSGGEYEALYTAYSSNATNFRNALSTPLSGYFSNSSANHQGSCGYFWSSTYSYSSYMYYLDVSSSDVDPKYDDYRYSGDSVRCLLK